MKHSKFLASLWLIGHVFMILYLAIAILAPLGVFVLAIVDPDLTRGRVWDLAASCGAAPLLISATGFFVKLYAQTKGKRWTGEAASHS